ncbi:MAG TPA: PD-(D/E)XK nuclease family protein [Burkholderiaceae bacterium]|nr:PD-(D/E)XK nuclease family protein [Burkholderiaceae bacterium]
MILDPDASISFDELVEDVLRVGQNADDILIVTVNNRYARRLVTVLAPRLGAGRAAAPLPGILPFTAWLRALGGQACFAPGGVAPARRLDTFASRRLWERVIARDEADRVLLDIAQAARHALDADRLVSDGYAETLPGEETDEYRRFQVWRRHYRAALADLDAEDDNLEYERVCGAAESGALALSFQTLVLAGFAALSPRQTRLMAALREAGVRICALHPDVGPACRVERVVADEPDAEWRLAAQWAADSLERRPAGRFAIIAARLDSDVVLAHRVLRDALRVPADTPRLEPGIDHAVDALNASLRPVRPYDVAVARPLGEWVHARAALAWLRVLSSFSEQDACSVDTLGAALLAGCCAGASTESSARAALDVAWRRRGTMVVTVKEFVERLTVTAPRLAASWTDWKSTRRGAPTETTVGAWVDLFRQWLRRIGFPGDAALDSHAYQVVEAFESALANLARQETVLGCLTASAALTLLRRLLDETLFQPQRDPSSRLEVLGFLESEGGRWDGVWVLGLTDDVLPAVPGPNPLIPLGALRRAQAPRATPDRELEWARTMVASFLASAPEVWFSHARRDGERDLRASPFFEASPTHPEGAPIASPSAKLVVTQVARRPVRGCVLDRLVDDNGPALVPGDKTRGGIGVIDTQARNPLWAFVKYRLGASDLPGYASLHDRNARGIFLHKAIELVWRLLDNQEGLLRARDDAMLDHLVEQATAQAGDECLRDYGPALKALEVLRGRTVLEAWLALECERPPFTVAALEQDCAWTFGPLDLSLRIDRVDRLADGRMAIIDYKSGLGRLDPKSDWMRERPIGLQLPFYAAVLAERTGQVAALVLARLHARKVEARGLADTDCGLPGLASPADWPLYADHSWERLMDDWRRAIEGLADEYAEGRAVNEIRNSADLDYCDARPFLRLNEDR